MDSEILERLQLEKAELDSKLVKLHSFLATDSFVNLKPVDRDDLRNQVYHMSVYSEILSRRIERAAS